MSATFSVPLLRVGEGGLTNGMEVKRIQQLLLAVGYDLGPWKDDGKWGRKTRDALLDFQRYSGEVCSAPKRDLFGTTSKTATRAWGAELGAGGLPVRPYVEHGDLCAFYLALHAGVLIPLAPKKRGITAFKQVHEWFEKNHTPYDFAWERGVWGLEDHPGYAVQTWRGKYEFSPPIKMDCTTYANLMMGVWARGNAHGTPFDASCGKRFAGGSAHLPFIRYGYKKCTRNVNGKKESGFNTLAQAQEVLKAQNKLYCLEVGGLKDGGVSHLALYLDGRVYEANKNTVNASMVYSVTLEKWWVGKHLVYIFGPSST